MGNKVTFYFNSFLHLSIFWKGHWYFILIVQLFKSNLLSDSWTSIQSRLTFTAVIDHWRLYIGWTHTLKDSYNASLFVRFWKGLKEQVVHLQLRSFVVCSGNINRRLIQSDNPGLGASPNFLISTPLSLLLNQPAIHSFMTFRFYKSVQFLR